MRQNHDCARYHLDEGQILLLAAAAPGQLTVTDGTVWLTREDGEDITLRIGDCIPIDEGVAPIASALRGAAAFGAAADQAQKAARAA